MSSAQDARALIARLGLAAHPEGGWYRETWRAPAGADGRSAGTAILYLLDAGERSHWHKVDADELWLWHAGSPLLLETTADAGPVEQRPLGADVLAGETPQVRVPAGHWQAARADRGWALASCVVVPGFDFAGFTLAPAGWEPEPVRFARLWFGLAFLYGMIVLIPLYFRTPVGEPIYYYGFLGAAAATQLLYALTAVDPLRFRLLMLVGIFSKLSFAIPGLLLHATGRLPGGMLIAVAADLVLATGFAAGWIATRRA